jgi:pyruvate/2-oxoglutarate/acetoin dehydrogenase E1 component
MLYRSAVEEVPVGDYEIELGQARVARSGDDVTLVGWGQQVAVLEGAARLAAELHGVSCEVIDLRTLLPWDAETVEASVNKTGRCVRVLGSGGRHSEGKGVGKSGGGRGDGRARGFVFASMLCGTRSKI